MSIESFLPSRSPGRGARSVESGTQYERVHKAALDRVGALNTLRRKLHGWQIADDLCHDAEELFSLPSDERISVLRAYLVKTEQLFQDLSNLYDARERRRIQIEKEHSFAAHRRCERRCATMLFARGEVGPLLRASQLLNDGWQTASVKVGASNSAPTMRTMQTSDGRSGVFFGKNALQEGVYTFNPPPEDIYQEVRDSEGQIVLEKDPRPSDGDTVYVRTWDPRLGHVFVADEGFTEKHKAFIRQQSDPRTVLSIREAIAKRAGIDPQDVRVNSPEQPAARIGLLPGEGPAREAIAYYTDVLFSLGVVPVTLMRPEPSGFDVVSLQEGVRPSSETPVREFTWNEMRALYYAPPAEWVELLFNTPYSELKESVRPFRERYEKAVKAGVTEDSLELDRPGQGRVEVIPLPGDERVEHLKSSLVRIACLDALLGSLDGHDRNFIFDQASGVISRIDSGSCLSLFGGEHVYLQPEKKGGQPSYYNEYFRSLAIEIVSRHGLELDPETRSMFQRVYHDIQKDGSPEREHVFDMLRIAFHGSPETVIQWQFSLFMDRLKDIVDHGRPTLFIPGTNQMPLFPFLEEAETAQEGSDQGLGEGVGPEIEVTDSDW